MKLIDLQTHRSRCNLSAKSYSSLQSSYNIQSGPGRSSLINSSLHSNTSAQGPSGGYFKGATGQTPQKNSKKDYNNNNSKLAATGYSSLKISAATGNASLSANRRNPATPNRYTFKCPYCNEHNLTMEDLRDHCNRSHKDGDKNMVFYYLHFTFEQK